LQRKKISFWKQIQNKLYQQKPLRVGQKSTEIPVVLVKKPGKNQTLEEKNQGVFKFQILTFWNRRQNKVKAP
jgi:hypothetical protein